MRILITTTHVPFVTGGAEIHARSLLDALKRHGHEAEIVSIPFKWYPPAAIFDHLMACRLLDLTESSGVKVDRVIGLKFPAYHIPHPNKVLWILHQHRTAFDLWGTPNCDLANFPEGAEMRDAIDKVERRLLREARALFANSQTVSDRLQKYSGVTVPPLYHPPKDAEKFYTAAAEPFFFFPSRISELKRQELVLRSLAFTKEPVVVHFAGRPDNPDFGKKLEALTSELKLDKKVRWLGPVSDEEMKSAYARCLAVLYPPKDEDYGYVTLEAMLSSKPVITCADSGGPLEFISQEHNGLIAEPTPESLAAALDFAWKNKSWASKAGRLGLDTYRSKNISWENVVQKLLA